MNIRKKMIIRLSLVLGIISIIGMSCKSEKNPPVITSGLSVSAVTSTAGGSYAPRNIVAIWVETNSGTFVKSLAVYAEARKSDLTNWQAKSMGNTVDAATGATRPAFGTVTATWNGKDVTGNVVADGTYKVCMELTDKGGTGNFSSFTFTKGAAAGTKTPANVPSFSTISIKWMPL